MRKQRVAFLGFGGITGAHAPAFEAARDVCEIVAVADPVPENVERARQCFGAQVRGYQDYAGLLACEKLDAVDITLPHHLHAPATVAAARAGCHVLVEKVMARNVSECDLMIDACRRAGVSLTVVHDRRYAGPWVAMKRVVDLGVLGEVFYWRLEHNQNVSVPEGHWIRRKDTLGGGAIMSCLTHQIDALRWYGGEVDCVTCMTKTIPSRMEGEFAGVVVAKMKSGALANLAINWWTASIAAGPDSLWYEMNQACGTKGEAYFMHGRGTFVKLHQKPNVRTDLFDVERALLEFVPVPWPDERGHMRCIAEWIKSLRGEPAEILTSGEDVRGTVEVAEAAYLSERTGQAVQLPLPRTQHGAQPWITGQGGGQ